MWIGAEGGREVCVERGKALPGADLGEDVGAGAGGRGLGEKRAEGVCG